tara:strand:- start:10477 stop:10953 length:477 start_codon:yes stop_codon:yes gene_type:complete
MTNKTRYERLKDLTNTAITSNNLRSERLKIAKSEAFIQIEKASKNPSLYLIELMKVEILESHTKIGEIKKRIYVGQVDAGGVWGAQLAYLKLNNKGILYFYIENLPSGWALSQVINNKLVTIDGGQRWEAIIHPKTWGNCRQILEGMTDTLHALTARL